MKHARCWKVFFTTQMTTGRMYKGLFFSMAILIFRIIYYLPPFRVPGSVILRNVYGHQGTSILNWISFKITSETLHHREVEKDDRFVEIGKQGANYSGDSANYMFLDVLPWRTYLFFYKHLWNAFRQWFSAASSWMVPMGWISSNSSRGQEGFVRDAIRAVQCRQGKICTIFTNFEITSLRHWCTIV